MRMQKSGVTMSSKRNIGNELIQGMEEAVKYIRGRKTRTVAHKVKIPKKSASKISHLRSQKAICKRKSVKIHA